MFIYNTLGLVSLGGNLSPIRPSAIKVTLCIFVNVVRLTFTICVCNINYQTIVTSFKPKYVEYWIKLTTALKFVVGFY